MKKFLCFCMAGLTAMIGFAGCNTAPADTTAPDTTAADIEDWDSIEQINLLLTIEKEFGIKLSVGDAEGLRNVGEMLDLIESKLQ